MAYTPSAYKIGKGSTITIGSVGPITNARVIQMPTMTAEAVEIVHLGGVDVDVTNVTSYGELVAEVPTAQTTSLVIGTEYAITVVLADGTTPISTKNGKLVSIGMGSIASGDATVKALTFRMTQSPAYS